MCCAGEPTLQELQEIEDPELDELKDAAEEARRRQMVQRRAAQRQSLAEPVQDKSAKRALEYRKAHPTTMEAAGTCDDASAPPAALLSLLRTREMFWLPAVLRPAWCASFSIFLLD